MVSRVIVRGKLKEKVTYIREDEIFYSQAHASTSTDMRDMRDRQTQRET